MAQDDDQTSNDFARAVNLAPAELKRWLDTDESKEVGQKSDGLSESSGHRMGRRIVELRQTKKPDLTEDDYDAMRKVLGYIKRHSAQRPDGGVEHSRWRYSLMNWGHDPLK